MVSKQPRKKRKELFNLPLHKRRKQMSARLSEELSKTYKKRNVPVCKGDRVRIVRGDFRGKEGKVTSVDRKNYRLGIEGIAVKKISGKEIPVSVHPSKVMIIEMQVTDEERKKALGR